MFQHLFQCGYGELPVIASDVQMHIGGQDFLCNTIEHVFGLTGYIGDIRTVNLIDRNRYSRVCRPVCIVADSGNIIGGFSKTVAYSCYIH